MSLFHLQCEKPSLFQKKDDFVSYSYPEKTNPYIGYVPV